MPDNLTILLHPEDLSEGSPEERATFGIFSVVANNSLLTTGLDTEREQFQRGPYVPGYPIAEWLAWNWWRLRWELGRPSESSATMRWEFTHKMSSIGEGYSWPNITIYSDGLRSIIGSDPSDGRDRLLFRYLGHRHREVVSCTELEVALDGFVEDMLNSLKANDLVTTNLARIWTDLTEEREDDSLSRFRKLEAQLGCDPDELDERLVYRHLESAAAVGEDAFGEVASDTAFHGHDPSTTMAASDMLELSRRTGFETNSRDAIHLQDGTELRKTEHVEAWRLGERLAKLVRQQEGLNGQPISDELLADFAGTTRNVISDRLRRSDIISFVLEAGKEGDRLSLRPKWETGRRFELARLIGDRLASGSECGGREKLFPATRTYSYRQKMQRAFAAELLSPFACVDEMLEGDYSEERQNDVAEHFRVSPMTIQTQLLNRRRINQDEAPDIGARGPEM